MKSLKFIFLAAFCAVVARAQSTDLAPTNLSSVILNGSIASSTGGASGNGTFSTLFASNGIDYSLTAEGGLTSGVPFTYTKTGANTGRVMEGANGTNPAVNVDMTFTSASAGTFVANYTGGATQRGTFTIVSVAFTSPLVNVSTRTTLAANGTATTGFVIGGSGPRRVLVRAIGPGLTQFGVTSALVNPSITLFRGTTQVGANDDFGSGANVDATLPAAFTRVGAFGLTAGSRDSAMIATLEPGAYTAQIRGGSATETGEVLLEVYFLD